MIYLIAGIYSAWIGIVADSSAMNTATSATASIRAIAPQPIVTNGRIVRMRAGRAGTWIIANVIGAGIAIVTIGIRATDTGGYVIATIKSFVTGIGGADVGIVARHWCPALAGIRGLVADFRSVAVLAITAIHCGARLTASSRITNLSAVAIETVLAGGVIGRMGAGIRRLIAGISGAGNGVRAIGSGAGLARIR